jgi:hypothetical protein
MRRRLVESGEVIFMPPCLFCMENHECNTQGRVKMPFPPWLSAPGGGAGGLPFASQTMLVAHVKLRLQREVSKSEAGRNTP